MSEIYKYIADLSDCKSRVKLLVVDDEEFALKPFLEARGFSLTSWPDLYDVEAASLFPVVICDRVGVGRSFGRHGDGGHIISALRDQYPLHYLIMYSSQPVYADSIEKADIRLSKTESDEVWVKALNTAILSVSSPYHLWKRARRFLVETDIDAYRLHILERSYYESLRKGRNFRKFSRQAHSMDLTLPHRSVALNLTAIGNTLLSEGRG